jgi:hypothetical protein
MRRPITGRVFGRRIFVLSSLRASNVSFRRPHFSQIFLRGYRFRVLVLLAKAWRVSGGAAYPRTFTRPLPRRPTGRCPSQHLHPLQVPRLQQHVTRRVELPSAQILPQPHQSARSPIEGSVELGDGMPASRNFLRLVQQPRPAQQPRPVQHRLPLG